LQDWEITYLPHVVVPAELPVQLNAFKRQQFRWAKGSIQTALKLIKKMWRAPHPIWRKLMGTMHLTNYAVHPLMLLNLFLTLPMALSQSPILLPTAAFVASAVGPPLLYWTAMQANSIPLRSRLGRLSTLIGLGTGLSLNNSRAVFEAVFNIQSDFKRTPKFAVTRQSTMWQNSTYALPRDPAVWLELVLALYACGLLVWVILQGIWWLIPWLLMYAGGYSYIAGLAFVQARQTRSARLKPASANILSTE
jgi:cellulose synthase/poly-beta-1,6-N-acetylglucosamine synthase-like glycosyltransferase